MADPRLYQRLAQAIQAQDGKIGRDASAFIKRFLAQLRAEGYRLAGDAEQALTEYLNSIKPTLKAGIGTAAAIGTGGSLMSPEVLAMTSHAFRQRWPDGLTLSKRLWYWQDETRTGLTDILAGGIRQGDAVGKTIYDMQRLIERNDGNRFEIVSNHKVKWVENLADAGKAMIHTPEAKLAWDKAVADAEAYIEKLAVTSTRRDAERLLSQIKEAIKKGNEALIDEAVKWKVYDKQLYNLKRIARTEMATAAHRAVIASSIDDPDIIGFQWRLSASHKVPDICDYYANIEMGLGKGVWTKEAVPHHKAHPHCMCLLTARVTKIKERGSQGYAEFINNASPELRDKLLPEWVKQAVKEGVPLAKLVRKDGFGLVTKKAATDLVNHQVVENIVAKLVEKAKNDKSLKDLWANPPGLKGHIDKRIQQGHAKDADDYYQQIKTALTSAETFNISVDARYPLIEFIAGNWSVILNHDGFIKTAYRFEKTMKTFTSNQTDKGYKVYGYDITTRLGQQLKKLFNRY